MEKLSFEQMEQVNGGDACSTTMFIVGVAFGIGACFFTGGTAFALAGIGVYYGAIGEFICYG